MGNAHLINGGTHLDPRGKLNYINEFDMEPIRRFYTIEQNDTEIERGWRAHKIEQRWFHVCKGIFKVKLIKIDDWLKPSKNLNQEVYILKAQETSILHLPAGYASCIQALENDSKIVVFADYGVEHAKYDDYIFPLSYFKTEQ